MRKKDRLGFERANRPYLRHESIQNKMKIGSLQLENTMAEQMALKRYLGKQNVHLQRVAVGINREYVDRKIYN